MARLLGKYEFPEGLYYSKDHMWAKIEDGKIRVGLTDFGQQAAGKILMVRPRPLGKSVEQGKILGTMETGKWVGPLKAPVGGSLIEFNEPLRAVKTADIVNKSPYGEGWMFVLKPANLEKDLRNLLVDVEEIEEWLKEEEKKLKKEG